MFTWPKLELTDWERRYVRPYSQEVTLQDGRRVRLPGVLRRVYPRTISNIPLTAPPAAQVQIARRSRVFGLTFSGDMSYTRLQITNATGTQFTMPDQRLGVFPYVTALLGGTPLMAGSILGPSSALPVSQAAPWLIDPNWVLQPNETLIFNGMWATTESVRVLNIGVHVWEFPGMENADKTNVEVG
jgi:hypothetical protein